MTSAQASTVLQHMRRLGPTAEAPDALLLDRFVSDRDGAAFAALVRRYAPMVLNVCRGVLRHEHDAEDALQATFLVLARRAGSIRRREALAGWLYEVAHRVAARAQAGAARRRDQERKVLPAAAADSTLEMTLRDLHRVLHEELRRLPDKYRLPLILCYLEGRSQEEAATLLGWTKGTLRGRLDRGREHLRRRLTSRGIALSAILCAAVVAPQAIAERQIESVLSATSGAAPVPIVALANGAMRAVVAGKLKAAGAGLLAAGILFAAVALGQQGREPAKSPPPPVAKSPAAEAKPPTADVNDLTRYSGRVLGPDGKPVTGAKIYLKDMSGYYRHPSPVPESATSGTEGRFEFSVSKAKFEERRGARVVAAASQFGPGWVELKQGRPRDELTIRLAADDVQITGRVVDLQGKPIPNATFTVWQIHEPVGSDLGPWTEAATAKKGEVLDLEQKYFRYTTVPCPKATTDKDGKFRLTGIGRNRLVRAVLEGPAIASQHVCVLTRRGKPIEVVYRKGNREYGEPSEVTTYYGADFRIVAAPCQPVVGVVRDAQTKKPIAGATVRSDSQMYSPYISRRVDPEVQTKTDADGRYRLSGMPTGKGYSIAVVPGKDQPYVPRHVDVPAGVGIGDVEVDIDLKRGVWIEGKITDKVTGKPLKGTVEYFSLHSNPNLADYPGYDGTILMGDLYVAAQDDGSFRVVGLPGPGVVGVYYQRQPYLRADRREDEFGTKEKSLMTAPYIICFASNYNALAKVNPARGAESVKCDVTVDPGWTFRATVLDPAGKPLAGARILNLNDDRMWSKPLPSADFAGGFNPARLSDIVVLHPERGFVGRAQPPKQNGGRITVKLLPGAAVTGRLVDADGKPLAGVELNLAFQSKDWKAWEDYLPPLIKTDRDGRFRIEALVPDYEYRLKGDRGEVRFGAGLGSGRTTDLGDVRLKRPEQ